MITSTRNPKVQWVRSLQSQAKARRQANAFVIEGVRLVEEALSASITTQLVFFSEDLNQRGIRLVTGYQEQGVQVEQVSVDVLKAASDTDTPQGILAVLPIQPLPLPEPPDFVLVLDGIRDPGNLGTILRTATGAGVQAVLLAGGTADPYSPKVVRSAMGAHFKLAFRDMEWSEVEAYLGGKGVSRSPNIYLADSGGGHVYTQADFKSPLALIVGSEAAGAGGEAHRLAGTRIHIPMPGKSESLNAAVATGILLFEVVRQRTGSS